MAAWLELYPPANFPGFWQALEGAIAAGDVVASREVQREIRNRDDALYSWSRKHGALFVEVDVPCQDQVTEIMRKYPRFVDTRTGKNSGDPFVIALAMQYKPQLQIVTQENGGNANRPAIPSVCALEGLRCISLLDLIRAQGWRF